MFGISVRVHPMFWVISAILGWNLMEEKAGVPFLLTWIGCVFVSILIHELGHVVAGRMFGAFGNIVLYSFGGLAIGSSNLSRRWQRLIVYLAGPAAQFLLLGLLLALVRQPAIRERLGHYPLAIAALLFLIEINWLWPMVNLLPLWPLDGGRVSRELFQWWLPRQGVRISLIVSLLVAAVIALNTLAAAYDYPSLERLHPWLAILNMGSPINAVFFGIFAIIAITELQQLGGSSRSRRWEREERQERLPWERDPDFWKK
jgi:stage IV sporulation protein FB